MTTPMSESSRARSSASFISATVSGRNAFRTSGRLIVIFAMPSSVRSNLMSVNCLMGAQVSAMDRNLLHLHELAQSRRKRFRLLPRHAMRRALGDPQRRARQQLDRALPLRDVLRIAASGDPEHRNLDL